MSISIYYWFEHERDLALDETLLKIAKEWERALPAAYEPWTWYDTERIGGRYRIEGCTKISPEMEMAWKEIKLAARLLSELRNEVGGVEWRVSVDDHILPWRSAERMFDPN